MSSTENVVLNSIQPTVTDSHDVVRFKENKIVRHLLDSHPTMNLNTIAAGDFTQDDRQHFAQLIGYSVSAWGGLSYVSDDNYNAVKAMQDGADETQARINSLQTELDHFREVMREPVARLYGIHPDDLERT